MPIEWTRCEKCNKVIPRITAPLCRECLKCQPH